MQLHRITTTMTKVCFIFTTFVTLWAYNSGWRPDMQLSKLSKKQCDIEQAEYNILYIQIPKMNITNSIIVKNTEPRNKYLVEN